MSTRTKLSKRDLAEVTFHVMPRDQGQIVEYAYGLLADGSGGGVVVCRRTDRSDGGVEYTAAESDGEFEPWNGDHGAGGEFLPLAVR